ncbi:MAG: hypothetical protein Q8J92_06940 [Parvibaculum sp.]|nr:hypothetical protein [Parvibaculum sp.]
MRIGWRSRALLVEKYHPTGSGFSTSELMALMQYDRINFERWVTYGSALVDKREMEKAGLERILTYFAARFVWAKEVLEREKKFAFLERWAARILEKRLSPIAVQFSICEDVKKEAQHLAIVLGDKSSDAFFDTRKFSRFILSVSPRLSIRDIVLMDEADVRGPVLH